MKHFGIELEFFVSKDNKIIPAYLATQNLDGDPFVGEIKSDVFDNIIDTVYDLKKKLFIESEKLESKGYKLELINNNKFTNEELRDARKDAQVIDLKELEILEELSIYPNGKLGHLTQRGFKKASLQVNISENDKLYYDDYYKISIDDKSEWKYESKSKMYSSVFNFLKILLDLDKAFKDEIKTSKRTKGVYAIKDGNLGKRIEYRSLPNNIDLSKLINLLK